MIEVNSLTDLTSSIYSSEIVKVSPKRAVHAAAALPGLNLNWDIFTEYRHVLITQIRTVFVYGALKNALLQKCLQKLYNYILLVQPTLVSKPVALFVVFIQQL